MHGPKRLFFKGRGRSIHSSIQTHIVRTAKLFSAVDGHQHCSIDRTVMSPVRFRKCSIHNRNNRKGRVKTTTEENQFERLAESVTPLYMKSYDLQLQIKEHYMKKALRKVINIIFNSLVGQISPELRRFAEENEGQICPLVGVMGSPVIYNYRNKDEMSVGPGIDGNRKTVGMYVGRGKDGRVVCVNPTHLVNICKKHKELAMAYQDFIRCSPLPACHVLNDGGHWKTVVMRSSVKGDSMLSISFHPQRKSEDIQQKGKEELLNYFLHGPGRMLGLSSLYFQPCPHVRCMNEQVPFQLLHGDSHLYEKLLGRTFRISPDSFFQTNTQGAEVLYSVIREFVQSTSASALFDVCCGTGTIGILLSDLVEQVFGIEILHQAVADAHSNAKLNGTENVEFVCGKAHQVLPNLLKRDGLGKAVAVINPGRNGLSSRVMSSVRACDAVKYLVYVSCKPEGNALANIINLIVPESDSHPGKPFIPLKAVAVDMFPHTLHCELVVMFER